MMKSIAIASAFAGFVAADAKVGEVFVATDANFDGFLKEHESSLVKFYAPWCGHCKSMVPAYEEAAKKLGEEGSKVILAKVDATVESAIAGKHEVRGYPTIKWFVDGSGSEYDGPRDADGIVSWIKKMSGPAVVEGTPAEDAVFSVAFYGSKASEAFEKVAKKNRKAAAFHFVNLEGESKIVFQHKKESAIEVSADMDEEKLAAELKKNQFPLFGALDGNTFGTYVDSAAGLVWSLFKMEKDEAQKVAEDNRDMMTKVAKALSADDIKVTWTNTNEFAQVLTNMFGIKEYPRIVFQTKAGDKKKFIYDGEMTADKIQKFIEDAKAGKIEADLKSEAVPENAGNAGEVRKVVGKSMKDMLFHADKDVLFEVYAPWCGHCKSLEPEYNKVAKEIEEKNLESKVMLAKLDGTENDSPLDDFEWQGFPTLWYIKAGSDKPMSYTGGRNAEGIWTFIKENHSDKEAIKAAFEAKEEKKEEETAASDEEL